MKILLIANYNLNSGGISGQVKLLYRNLNNEKSFVANIFSTKTTLFRRLILPIILYKTGKEYDVFHIHACSNFGFIPAIIGVIIGKLLNKRIILTYHGGGAENFFRRHKILVRFFLKRTDANIVLSGFLASIFDKYQLQYNVIQNIIECDRTKFKKRLAIRPVFISVRTLAPNYNIECIIDAFEIVNNKIPSSSLYILGDGPSKNKLEAMVSERKIENVFFVGRVDNENIYSYLDKADIFLSSPIEDNQPMSVLEAFNAGLIVISSNVGGIPYMIQDGKNGLLFESKNSADLAEKMLWTINNPKRTLEVIDEANKSLNYYCWNRIRGRLIDLYYTQ